jgi:phage-related protein
VMLMAVERSIGPILLRIGGFLTGPIGIAITLALTLIGLFHKQIVQLARNLSSAFSQVGHNIAAAMGGAVDYAIRAFYKLPEGIQRALIAVVNIVKQAALAVYRLFSYFNPWAHHSPSLVESVTTGMAAVLQQYSKFTTISSAFAQSVRDLQTFKRISAGLQIDEFQANRGSVKSAMPQNLALYDRLVQEYKVLNGVADTYSDKIDAQQAVVDKWNAKLKDANAALDAQQNILQRLQSQLDGTQKLMDSYQDKINNFANAPIQGMRAFSDAIFENSMAQKKLQLQLLDLGGTDAIDKLRDKYDKLTGDIEMMMGKVSDLRGAGAGSDVLGPLEQQIEAMKSAQSGITGEINSSPISSLQAQLEALQTQAERLDLEQSLKFDPLTRQVDQLVNGMKELPFDQIVSGIQQNKDAIAALQPTMDAQTAAVARQQTVVDGLTAARDALQGSYDAEKAKLDSLTDAMQKYADQVSAIKSALDELASSSTQASAAGARGRGGSGGGQGPGASAFDAGGLGDFPKVGGNASLGREGGMGDQSKLLEDFATQQSQILADTFGKFDMFAGIKKKWNEFTTWFGSNVTPAFEPLAHAFDGVDWSAGLDKAKGALEVVGGFLQKVGGWAEKIGRLFLPEINRIWKVLKDNFQKAIDTLWPEIAKFGDTWDDLKKALKVVGSFLGGELLIVLKVIASVFSNVLGPVLDVVIDLLGDLIRIIRGILEFVVGVFSGDWKMAWQGIEDIVGGTFEAIWHIIEGAGSILWGIVKGIVEGIVGFFQWLYDIIVGHSIIPDLMKAIVKWFNFIISPIQKVLDWLGAGWEAIKRTWDVAWTVIKTKFSSWWQGLKSVAMTVWNWFTGTFSTIIDKVKSAWSVSWNAIKDYVTSFWPRFKAGLQVIYDWIKDTLGSAIDKVKGAFTKSWSAIGDWFRQNGKRILSPLTSAINTAIDGINTLIKGLNKVADVLPGLDWNISLIPHFAAGGIPGRRVGNGFMTSGARAIVGEGKRNHPEFVIPTDPTYRNRAKSLYSLLGKYLGVPSQLASGGIIGSIKNAIGGAKDFASDLGGRVKDVGRGLVSSIMDPIRDTAYRLINRVDWLYGRQMARSVADQVFSWVGYANQAVRDAVGSGSTGSGTSMVNPGKTSIGGRAVLFDGGGWLQPGLTSILNKSNRPEPVFSSSQWTAIKNGGLGAGSLGNASVSMLTVERAIIKAERMEVATVTRRQDGVTEIHFHGDLSFPNIHDGNDAENFIKNLEGLAG